MISKSSTVGMLVVLTTRTLLIAQQPKNELSSKPMWQRMLQGDDAKKVAELQRRIGKLVEADNYANAYTLAQDLLALRQRLQGADHWEAVNQRVNGETIRWYSTLPQKAWIESREAEKTRKEAEVMEEQGEYGRAFSLLQKQLDWSRKFFGENHAMTAGWHSLVAENLYHQGKYGAAVLSYQKSLDISLGSLGEVHPDTAARYDHLARCFAAQGKYVDAETFDQKALAILCFVFGEHDSETARSYNSLAVDLDEQGKHANAGKIFQKVLDICRNTVGEEHTTTALVYGNFAVNLSRRGRPADAMPLFQRALDIRRKAFGEDHLRVAFLYSNIASELASQGKHADASNSYQKCLDIRIKKLGENHPDTATSYANLGRNMTAEKRYSDAWSWLQKSLDIRRHALGEDHPDTADSYGHLGSNLKRQRKYADAIPLHRRALDIYRQSLGDEHPRTGLGYNNLASDLTAQGKYTEARELLVFACRNYEIARLGVALRGLDRADFGRERSPYLLLSATHARLNDATLAWSAAEADLARGFLDESAKRRGLSMTPVERATRGRISTQLARLQPRILALVSRPSRTAAEAKELVLLQTERTARSKELGDLAAIISRREVAALLEVQSALPPDAALIFWVDAATKTFNSRDQWACVVRSTGTPVWEQLPGTNSNLAWNKDDSVLASEVRAAVSAKMQTDVVMDLAKRLYNQRFALFEKHLQGVRRLEVVPVGEMAGVPVEALTDRFIVSYTPSGTALARRGKRARPASNGLLALGDPLFDHEGRKPKSLSPLPAGGLLITRVVPGGNAADARLQAGDVLLGYAGTELKDAGQLGQLIAANAQNNSIPVQVWRESEGKSTTREVAPGKLDVLLAKEPAPEAIAAKRKTDAMLSKLRGGDWNDLPGTRVEVVKLAKLFGDSAELLFDSDASEQHLESMRAGDRLKNYRYLHFATHGETNNYKAFESALILAQDKLPKDPLANLNRPKDAHFIDGRMTANEVLAGWKLDSELVTLSACESGLGRSGGGDGLLGFAQAFLLAGSRSVCLSLWKVDDTATALLMGRFYESLLGKRPGLDKPMPKAEALAEAKRWLRELTMEQASQLTADLTNSVPRAKGAKPLKLLPPPAADPKNPGANRPFSHPHYWAAFILIGDPN